MNNYYSYESFDNAVNNTVGGTHNSKLDEPIAEQTQTKPAETPASTPSANTTKPAETPATPPPTNADVITMPTPTTVYHSISCVQKKLTDFEKLNKTTKIADADMKNMMDKCPANENDKLPKTEETNGAKEPVGICKLSPYVKGFVKKLTDVTTSVNINYIVLAVVVIVLIIYGLLGNNTENDVQMKSSTDL